MKVTLIGIDLAKNIFQVAGVNQAGKVVFNKQVKRRRLMALLLNYPEAQIAMEACGGSNPAPATILYPSIDYHTYNLIPFH
jgi:transposase